MPADVVEQRREQLESRNRKSKPTSPATKRTKIEKPLSSLVDLPDPEPPPVQAKTVQAETVQAETVQAKPAKPIVAISKVESTKKPPPLPARDNESIEARQKTSEQQPTHDSDIAVPETTGDVAKLLDATDSEVPVRGYEPNRDKIATVRWLATAILLTGLIGTIPAILDVVEHSTSQTSAGLSRWACALLLIGVLQSAYTIYLVQLPDWSSVWVVTIFTLVIAAGYAAMFGLTMLATDHSQFVQYLDLADRLRGGKATAWCLIMLSLMSLTSYFSGRIGAQWRNAFVG